MGTQEDANGLRKRQSNRCTNLESYTRLYYVR